MLRHKGADVVFAPDDGRDGTSRDGVTLCLLVVVTGVWAALAVAAVLLLNDVRKTRAELQEHVTWVTKAERLRADVGRLVVAARNAETFAGGDETEELERGAPWHERATPTQREVSRAVVDAIRSAEGTPIGDPARHALAATAPRFSIEVSRAVRNERGAVAELSRDVDVAWTQVFAFGAVSLFSLGTLILILWVSRREKRALRVQERRLRTLVQTAQDLIWAVDAQGRWSFVNDAARRIYGYAPEEMIGRPFVDFMVPELAEKDTATFRRILAGDDDAHYETEHVRKDGRRITLLYRATVMRDEKGRVLGTMGTATDVTDMRRMQEQVLLHERLQAVATLGGGVAHDFNNLLTVIIGQAQVAKAKEDLPPQLDRRLNSILDTAERARKLTQQLIAFARRQPTSHEVIDLVAVVRQMQDLLGNLVGGPIRIREELAAEPVRVEADWGQIDQVIMNFVVNARDALPHGGQITIAVRPHELSGDTAHKLGLAPGAWALLEVRDDGEGMDEETLKHVFEPFFTTKEPGKGTGLGLANVYGVVAQHGGAVDVESAPGEGTTMRVYLPLVSTPEALSPRKGPSLSQTFPVSAVPG